jgi:tetratricopeptide (TPR) repeat protein
LFVVIALVIAAVLMGAGIFFGTDWGRREISGWLRSEARQVASDGQCDKAVTFTLWAERIRSAGSGEYQAIIHCYFHVSDYSGAHAALNQIEKQTQGNTRIAALNVARAEVYEMEGDCKNQRLFAERAIDYDKNRPGGYVLLATSYQCFLNPLDPKVEAALLRALELQPDHARALNALGAVRMYRYDRDKKESDFGEGVDLFTKSIAADPREWRAYYNLGVDYFAFKQDFEKSIDYLEKFSQLITQVYDGGLKGSDGAAVEVNAYYHLSSAYNAVGETNKSLTVISRMRDLIQRDPSVLEKIGVPLSSDIEKLINESEND